MPDSFILGTRVDPTSYADSTQQVLSLVRAGQGGYVCVANVHMIMEAFDDPAFRDVVNQANLTTPDGMPLVWALRWLGWAGQERVYGPELTLRLCEAAARENVPVGFLGGAPDTLERLIKNLQLRFPQLHIGYQYSPPFRAQTDAEDHALTADINASGVKILFVGLGCPKQEWWMFHHRPRLKPVLLGVGAAFDFHAGSKRQSPAWMQKMGLEWLFRFSQEPRRLWRRYVYHNPRFIFFLVLQLLSRRWGR